MAKGKVVIGGDLVKEKGVEAIKDLQENRTMIVQKLTQSPPSKPEVVDGLKSIDEVFEHFKPSAEVRFKDHEGGSVSEELKFKSLADFSLNGLTEFPFGSPATVEINRRSCTGPIRRGRHGHSP